MASIYVVILDVNVQSMTARTVAAFISRNYDVLVKIKTFYITPELRVHAEEVMVNDKKHNPMFAVGELDAKLSLRDFPEEIRIKNADITDLLVNLVVYEGSDAMNVAEIFKSDGDKKKNDNTTKPIIVENLKLVNGKTVVWNQNKDNSERKSMDYSHIDVSDINMSLRNVSYLEGVVTALVDNISMKEKSGFSVDSLFFKYPVTVSSKNLDLRGLNLHSHATDLDMDLQFIYNDYKDYSNFVDSVKIIANIRQSQLTLSDLMYFSQTMEKMPDTLQIKGLITGSVRDFTANNFYFAYKDSTDFLGDISMRGLPNFFETHIVANVEKMNFTYQDISDFAIPTPTGKIPLPEQLSSVKSALLSGKFYGFHNNFNTTFNFHTNVGNIYLDCALNNNLVIVSEPYYFCNIHANNINLKDILDIGDEMSVSMYAALSGTGLTKEDAKVQLNLEVGKFTFDGNSFTDFDIVTNLKDQRIFAHTNINSELLKLNFAGMVDISKSYPSYNFNVKIDDADLYALNLMDNDKTMLLSTHLVADMEGKGIDNLYGNIRFDNTAYHDSRGYYYMDSLNIDIEKNEFKSKNLYLTSDFFDMNAQGIINFKNIGNTFKNYVLNHFHVSKWADRGVRLSDEKQDFSMELVLKETETLSRLLMPELKISNNTNLTATFTSNKYQLYTTVESDRVEYNDIIFDDVLIKNKTVNNKTTMNLNMKDVIMKQPTEKNPIELGVENLGIVLDAHNDSLLVNVSWDDEITEDRNKGILEAVFLPYESHGGTLQLKSSGIVINDTLWNISPLSYIDFSNNGMYISNVGLYTTSQSLNVGGYYPKTKSDTLSLAFDKFDVSNFDELIHTYGIDVDCIIDGTLKLSGLSDKFTFLSKLDISDIGINNHQLGYGFINANWNAADTSIYIDTEIIRKDNDDKVMALTGNYFTSRKNDNLDFNLDLNDIDISMVNSFAKGVISRVKGYLSGDVKVSGSLNQLVFNGYADLTDAACKIDYLNTYYRINPRTAVPEMNQRKIKFSENRIDFKDLILVDTLNNEAMASGFITHDYLKDFKFNIDMSLDNFLAMDMLPDESASFYGTAVASGDLKINGPIDDIVMDIDITSMPGTTIDIKLISTASINDNFIVFVGKEKKLDTVTVKIPERSTDKKFTLNLDADVTETANVNIHLPSNMGLITANGNGNIRMGYAMDQLTLYGDYVINDGTFDFNFQNLVHRNFDIKQGGTISWTGDAAEADIDVTGSYRTKSSISSLGVELDSTSMVNNVNVDCILHLREKLNNPSITFGLDLPNSTDDIKNTVFSIIDTTNQAVMSQQIISLLVLGSFSYANASLYSVGATNYYNVLTSSLSSWLSQISKDFDVGVRYTPEDNLTAEEVEVALSTQLFNDKLTIDGNLGMYTESRTNLAGEASNIVGDVDVTYKITDRVSFKVYNHSNMSSNYYSYSYEAYSDYTQGIGISFSQSFDNIREIFVRKNRNKKVKKDKK